MIILILLLALSIFPQQTLAEWGRAADEPFRLPLNPGSTVVYVLSDDNGGCLVSAAAYGDLCHVDRYGNLTWDEIFDPTPNILGGTALPLLTDNGDVIISTNKTEWEQREQFPYRWEVMTASDVYIQRTNLDRELLWGENGIAIDTSDELYDIKGIYAGPVDNSYIIHSYKFDEDYRNFDSRLHLISGNGEFLWGDDGIELDWLSTLSYFVKSINQSFIIVQNIFSDPAVKIIKIDSEGETVWDLNYSTLLGDGRQSTLSFVESDRAGGVILAYRYTRYESPDDSIKYFGINAMRISAEGDSLWIRNLYERPIEYTEGLGAWIDPFQYCFVRIDYVYPDHFLIAWIDNLRYSPNPIQVDALDIDGEHLWEELVDIITDGQSSGPIEAAPSYDGICYAWKEINHDVHDWWRLLWGQRISSDGERTWGDHGRLIQVRPVYNIAVTTDGNGGMITVVHDQNSSGATVQMINCNGEIGEVLEVGVDDKIFLPNQFTTLETYPNPFNSTTTIVFGLDKLAPTRIAIYDLTGREIVTLINDKLEAGYYNVVWNAVAFPSGLYICRMDAGGFYQSRKLMLIR
ncbi:T9SS type A sorting domain-containing protein [bacterium]|nr:T9SS type A sorting domain-containing protein [bacterium]